MSSLHCTWIVNFDFGIYLEISDFGIYLEIRRVQSNFALAPHYSIIHKTYMQ